MKDKIRNLVKLAVDSGRLKDKTVNLLKFALACDHPEINSELAETRKLFVSVIVSVVVSVLNKENRNSMFYTEFIKEMGAGWTDGVYTIHDFIEDYGFKESIIKFPDYNNNGKLRIVCGKSEPLDKKIKYSLISKAFHFMDTSHIDRERDWEDAMSLIKELFRSMHQSKKKKYLLSIKNLKGCSRVELKSLYPGYLTKQRASRKKEQDERREKFYDDVELLKQN